MTDIRRREHSRVVRHRAEVVARAPGRVNLIGEHTDYNGGFVLPTVIPQRDARAAAPRRRQSRPRVEPRARRGDAARVQPRRRGARPGLARLRAGRDACALRGAGFEIGGFDLAIASDVPLGSGLSSSAALECRLLRALRGCSGSTFDDVQLAELGAARRRPTSSARRSASWTRWRASLAGDGEALFLDTRDAGVRARSRCRPAPSWSSSTPASRTSMPAATTARAARSASARRRCSASPQLRDVGVDELPRIARAARRRSTAAPGTSSPRTSGCSTPSRRCAPATPRRSARCSTRRTPRCATTTRSRCRRSTCWSRWRRPTRRLRRAADRRRLRRRGRRAGPRGRGTRRRRAHRRRLRREGRPAGDDPLAARGRAGPSSAVVACLTDAQKGPKTGSPPSGNAARAAACPGTGGGGSMSINSTRRTPVNTIRLVLADDHATIGMPSSSC